MPLSSLTQLRPLTWVAVGGAGGSLARWGLVSAGPSDRTELILLALNVVGSLFLGVLLGRRERLADELFLGLGSGFAGGLTTFSGYAVAVAANLDDGELAEAATTGLATPVLALLAAGLGFRLARRSMITRGRARARRRATPRRSPGAGR